MVSCSCRASQWTCQPWRRSPLRGLPAMVNDTNGLKPACMRGALERIPERVRVRHGARALPAGARVQDSAVSHAHTRQTGGGRPPPGGSLWSRWCVLLAARLESPSVGSHSRSGLLWRCSAFAPNTLEAGFNVSKKPFDNGDLLCSFATTGVQRAMREKREYPKGGEPLTRPREPGADFA